MILEIILLAKNHLENASIKDYKVPYESWVCLQFSPSNEFFDTAKRQSGRLNIQRKIQSFNTGSNQSHGNYWAMINCMWRHHTNWIYLAIEKQCTDFEFNTLPSLPTLPLESTITCFVKKNKTGIKARRDVTVASAVRTSRSYIVPVGTQFECHGHDFIWYKITSSVTPETNIGKTPDE